MTIEPWQLKQRQGLSLDLKIKMSQRRIREWFDHWNGQVAVSFSGGKDSTVLLHLVRSMFPQVDAVFLDSGLEFPEIRDFVKTVDSVTWIKPAKTFKQVVREYGFPVVSKETAQKIYEIRNTKSDKLRNLRLRGRPGARQSGRLPDKWLFLIHAPFKISAKCCDVLKKQPSKRYEKETGNKLFVGTMVEDSRLRGASYLKTGCNSYNTRPLSMPLAFWTEADVWEYIKRFDLAYSKIYEMGYKNTGCIFCAFGMHLADSPNKFQLMEKTHPSQWKYCLDVLKMRTVLDYVEIEYRNRQLNLFDK